MARSLLIALMVLAAVATPASADGLASSPASLPSYSPITVEQDSSGIVITVWIPDTSAVECQVVDCEARAAVHSGATGSQDEACAAFDFAATNYWPYWGVRLDPTGCVQKRIQAILEELPPTDDGLQSPI